MKEIPKPDIGQVFEHYGARILGADNGGWAKAECPLLDHDDNNPSASANRSECKWHCWTCDKGGDAVDLVMENEHSRFVDAVSFVTSHFGDGDGAVRSERLQSGLLPGRTGNRRTGGSFRAPWLSL